jgi:hypothetical protein
LKDNRSRPQRAEIKQREVYNSTFFSQLISVLSIIFWVIFKLLERTPKNSETMLASSK